MSLSSHHARKAKIAISAEPVGEVDEKYLSVCMDIGQIAEPTRFWNPNGSGEVVGEKSFDFGRSRLRNLTKALAPAYLRIGGTEADRAYYQLEGDIAKPPPRFRSVLHMTHLEAIGAFAWAVGFDICFTINGGPGNRNSGGLWNSNQARSLLRFIKERGFPFSVFEFGNEPNAFPLFHNGLTVEPEDFARDIDEFVSVRNDEFPNALVSAPATAYWPNVGEVPALSLTPRPRMIKNFLSRVIAATTLLDVVSWHYYPGLSDRSALARYRDSIVAVPLALLAVAVASKDRFPGIVTASILITTVLAAMLTGFLRWLVRPIRPSTFKTASNLNTVATFGERTHTIITSTARAQNRHPPALWLGETGSAQVGGQAGVSGRWAGTLWWLDQLGALALHGHKVQCRQTLCGHKDSYALIDQATLDPLPDFWASVLWKRLMGRQAFRVHVGTTVSKDASNLRMYCQQASNQAWDESGQISGPQTNLNGFVVLAINLGSEDYELDLPNESTVASWLLSASSPSSRVVMINGHIPKAADDGSIPKLIGKTGARLVVPAEAALFVLVRNLPHVE